MARVGPAMRAAGGMRVDRGRPGAWPSSVSSRSASQPRFAGLFVGRRSATAAVHAPGLRWHTGGRGRVRLRHGASQPALRRYFRRCGLSRPRPRPPWCQRLQGYRAARCPHGIPSLARHTAPLPMALPLWGSALARPVRTVGGRDGGCGGHRAPGRPPRIPEPQTAGDGPQAVPGEFVCRCECPRCV